MIHSSTRFLFRLSLGLAVTPVIADDVVIEVPRFEGAVQVSSGSIPNCCSNHSMSSQNASSLSIKGCSTMGGYCMGSRNAPFLTFDLSWIPEGVTIESVRLVGSRTSPRSGWGTAEVTFMPYGEVGTSMFNMFGSTQTSFNWSLASNFSINLGAAPFNAPDRDRFMIVRLTTGGDDASYIRNARDFAPKLSVTLATPPCVGDLNGNGMVNSTDLGFLISGWGEGDHEADLNEDGVVDSEDLGIMLSNWGSCPAP